METIKIYNSKSNFEIMTARHALREAGIESFVVDKKDSVYVGIFGGNIDLYVSNTESTKALEILKEIGVMDR